MSAKPRGQGEGEPTAGRAVPRKSGVVRRQDVDEAPPWAIVSAYLERGDHAEWVEGHAARSRAFADVLAALRHDHEERAPGRARVLPFRR